MKMLVESLKRMYKKGTLTKEQISERVSKGMDIITTATV